MGNPRQRRPLNDSVEELGFSRRHMVNWFDPKLLFQTAVKITLSNIFGAYADKRELLAVMNDEDRHDYSNEQELWFDYAADLGDGWDSGYTVARLLAAESLTPDGWQGEALPRGRLLLFGGDEVYPVATRDNYRDRLTGPYEAALPWVDDEAVAPHLYAIPGNHDWYDGLTSFTRLFCQHRWIGGWQTRQSRSYFVIKLPHNWWLWGVDVQLESDIDGPQKAYFHRRAAEMQPGDKVILCTPEPSWVYAELGDRAAHRNLQYLEEQVIKEHNASLEVVIAGDLHHYCRYQQVDGKRQLITSGGGGAFMHGTHNLPEKLQRDNQDESDHYEKKQSFPDAKCSAAMMWKNLLFPFLNPRFSLFIGGIYLLYSWLLQSSSIVLNDNTLLEQLSAMPLTWGGASGVLISFLQVLSHSPENVFFMLIVVLGIWGLVETLPGQTVCRYVVGTLHGLAHLLLNIALIWGFAVVNLGVLGMEAASLSQTTLFIIEILLSGALGGGLLMGSYLLLSNRLLAINRTAALSSLRVADYKSFLRLHLDKEGLTIYPIGVEKVPKCWRFATEGEQHAPWFEPQDREITPQLLEQPIRLTTTK